MSTLSNPKEDNILTLSFSRLFEYQTCPKRYYFSRVIGLQTRSNPHMVYGKALHAGVEAYLLAWSDSDKLERCLQAFGTAFESELGGPIYPAGFASKEHIDEMRVHGQKVLHGFHKRWQQNESDRIISAEQRFELLWEPASIRFMGVIDLVERNLLTGRICIVDFKSNTADHAKLRRLTRESLQLDVYSWAYKILFGEVPDLVTLESLETGERHYRKPALPSVIEANLTTTAARIRSGDFTALPKYSKCMFCAFKEICNDSVL